MDTGLAGTAEELRGGPVVDCQDGTVDRPPADMALVVTDDVTVTRAGCDVDADDELVSCCCCW